MALRLIGTAATWHRTTDHEEEISALHAAAQVARTELERLACGCGAALLACHDETGISLDDWAEPRALVEHLLGASILENRA